MVLPIMICRNVVIHGIPILNLVLQRLIFISSIRITVIQVWIAPFIVILKVLLILIFLIRIVELSNGQRVQLLRALHILLVSALIELNSRIVLSVVPIVSVPVRLHALATWVGVVDGVLRVCHLLVLTDFEAVSRSLHVVLALHIIWLRRFGYVNLSIVSYIHHFYILLFYEID